MEVVETNFLIVGAGPAGASLACFLTSYGLHGIMISSAPSTADTPRAHITNMAALECLRDIGLDKEVESVAVKNDHMMHTRWCYSMAGEEFARIHSWGNDPMRKGDYETASPCSHVDLPQTKLEPILVNYAAQHGFKVRFDTTFLQFEEQTDGSLLSTLQDNISGVKYQVKSKYLFGADGARSRILKQLNLPLNSKPGQGLALNILAKVELGHLMEHRKGNLHWILQPDKDYPDFGWTCVLRMVKPWHEWMFILFPKHGAMHTREVSNEEYLKRIKEFIGDENADVEILKVSKWYINETVAELYSKGNVFCLGDAVHRHPPFNGLGSNTCIQDAFNLAWKIAYVHNGKADPALLDTYTIERQPVGHSVITRANQALREHSQVWEALGMLSDDLEERKRAFAELSAPTPAGQARRQRLRDGVRQTRFEFHGLGVEMNQRYHGRAVYLHDEPRPFALFGRAATNSVLYHEPNTYPGSRLPHAWLGRAVPGPPVSTIDLAGHGGFTLLTGVGGAAWKTAAREVAAALNIPIAVYAIGYRQDYEDRYFDWERLRGVEESGAVLVRPDRFVAWRCTAVLKEEAQVEAKLLHVLRWVLGLN